MKEKPPVPLWLATAYCLTLVGPLWHTLRGLTCDRDWCWLWHTPACLGSVLGNAWGVLTFKRRGGDKKTHRRFACETNAQMTTPPTGLRQRGSRRIFPFPAFRCKLS